MMTRSGAQRFAAFIMLCLMADAAPAAYAESQPGQTSTLEQVEGVVSAVGAGGIAVEYARTETSSKEMYLPFDKALELRGARTVQDLQPGDTVLVDYRQTVIKNSFDEGIASSRVAVRVSRLAAAPPQAPELEEVETAGEPTDGS